MSENSSAPWAAAPDPTISYSHYGNKGYLEKACITRLVSAHSLRNLLQNWCAVFEWESCMRPYKMNLNKYKSGKTGQLLGLLLQTPLLIYVTSWSIWIRRMMMLKKKISLNICISNIYGHDHPSNWDLSTYTGIQIPKITHQHPLSFRVPDPSLPISNDTIFHFKTRGSVKIS